MQYFIGIDLLEILITYYCRMEKSPQIIFKQKNPKRNLKEIYLKRHPLNGKECMLFFFF